MAPPAARPSWLQRSARGCIYRRAASAFVWVVVHVRGQLVGDHLPLLGYVVLDGPPESGVTDVVRAVHDVREEAAGQLVLALRPGLEERHPAFDGELYALVITELEVQIAHVLDGAPVTPEYRISFEEKQRPRNRAAG